MITKLNIATQGKGLYELTQKLQQTVRDSGLDSGLCTVFIRHTSASLAIQENADPSVQTDILYWLERHVPDNDPMYTHTMEGPDDMPSHIKSLITQTTLSIPFEGQQLLLGTWQGAFVCEHRSHSQQRQIVVHLMAD